MKKTILNLKAFAVCGLMAALFVGCGGGSDEEGSESNPKSTPVEEEENKVDSLAVLRELDAEYEREQEEWKILFSNGAEIHQRNVMTCMVNRRGDILTSTAGHPHVCPIESVKYRAILFLTPCREAAAQATLPPGETVAPDESAAPSLPCHTDRDNTYPEIWEKYIDSFDAVPVSMGHVVLLKDVDCPSSILNEVRKELIGAVLEMRNIQSKQYYGRSYFELSIEERKSIDQMIPMAIYETTPE